MRTVATLLCLGLFGFPSYAIGATFDRADLGRLAWLEGVWIGSSNGTAMEEQWSSPAGGALIGMHKDTRDGRMTSFEFFRIVFVDSSGICYLASPNGRTATPFCAIEIGDSRVLFENREHDFPQRILYWREGEDRLHARIEGTIGGEKRSEEWLWSRRGRVPVASGPSPSR